jgi:small subunit ribosomal protein S6
MRKYELMTIYPVEEDKFKAGTDAVRAVLTEFGAAIEKEEPYGDRDLTYEVKKLNRGRFVLLTINANPAKIVDIDRQFKLNTNLLKFLFVKLDEEKAK